MSEHTPGPWCGLGEADDAGHPGVQPEFGQARRDRRLVVGGGRVGRYGRREQDEQAAPPRAELAGQHVRDVGRLGRRVQPAARTEMARYLRGKGRQGQRDRDGQEGDGAAEAVHERSPAAEHRAGLLYA